MSMAEAVKEGSMYICLWFQVFGELETEFAVFCLPFTVKAVDLPVDIQLEIVDLQCDQDLKDQFASSDLDTF